MLVVVYNIRYFTEPAATGWNELHTECGLLIKKKLLVISRNSYTCTCMIYSLSGIYIWNSAQWAGQKNPGDYSLGPRHWEIQWFHWWVVCFLSHQRLAAFKVYGELIQYEIWEHGQCGLALLDTLESVLYESTQLVVNFCLLWIWNQCQYLISSWGLGKIFQTNALLY